MSTPGSELQPKKITPETDQRFFPRASLVIPAAYKILKDAQGNPVNLDIKMSETADVSAVGMRLRVKEEVVLNSLVQVALDFYRNDQPIRIDCLVVRCTPSKEAGTFDAGLMFVNISNEERRKMNSYVTQALAQGLTA